MNKLVLIGGTQRAKETLLAILQRQDIDIQYLFVMAGDNEDEAASATEMHKIALERGLPVKVLQKVEAPDITLIQSLQTDALIGIGIWRSRLPAEFLNAARLGYLAVHGTGLPAYRGWAGINWQIINGEPEIKMHGFRLNDEIDAGELLCDENKALIAGKVCLQNEKHLAELFEDYSKEHIRLTNSIIDKVITDDIGFIPQNEELASYSCNRNPDDGEIDWNSPSNDVFNFIRAQSSPYAGAFTYFKGQRINIHRTTVRSEFKNYIGRIPGKVIERNRDTGTAIILTQDSALEVIEVAVQQSSGKTPFEVFSSVRDRCKNRVEAYLDSIDWR